MCSHSTSCGVIDSPIAKRGCDVASIRATLAPWRARMAAVTEPARPEPRITTSQWLTLGDCPRVVFGMGAAMVMVFAVLVGWSGGRHGQDRRGLRPRLGRAQRLEAVGAQGGLHVGARVGDGRIGAEHPDR